MGRSCKMSVYAEFVNLIVWVVLFVGEGTGQDVEFQYLDDCYSDTTGITMQATYTGSGNVTAVKWYYSGKNETGNLVVSAESCTIAGRVPQGYPDASNMQFECPATNTFNLTLTNLQEEEIRGSWGATFIVSSGTDPALMESELPICSGGGEIIIEPTSINQGVTGSTEKTSKGETIAPTSKTTQTSSSTNHGDGPPLEIILPCVLGGVIIIISVIVWLKVCLRRPGDGPQNGLSCRPESEGAVSRRDVDLQESYKFTRRTMPSIPPDHDAKGRGLCASFDDDHPMISVGIPSKKAGALDPLHEDKGDQERKKKKKKKNPEKMEEDE